MYTITMPQAGNSMEEGTILRWRKQEGERVAKGDVLLEIETDKATVEVEADRDGTLLKILVREGAVVAVRDAIGVLGEPGEPDTVDAQKKEETPSGSVTPILMPQVSNSMEEGTVVKWRVAEGERIAQGQIIFDVETDKAVVEVEATDAGRVARIVVPEGGVIAIKQPVAYLAERDADVEVYLKGAGATVRAAEVPLAKTNNVSPPVESSPQPTAIGPAAPGGRVKASPAARKTARQQGIDLEAVGSGSGPGGRILSTDVEARGSGAGAQMAGGPTRRKASGMRRAIARNLTTSKQTVPHFYLKLTIDAAPLVDFRNEQKKKFNVSVNDVIIMAVARAVAEFPAFRSQYQADEIVEYPTANIGMAVGMEEGLVVPVLIGAEAMSLEQVAGETRRLVESARKGKIEGMGQGVFTISNMGMFGVEEFTAIINPPESGILAVSAIREDVIVKDGEMRAGKVMSLVLSCDHRVVDGMAAAKFAGRLKELLEGPGGWVKES